MGEGEEVINQLLMNTRSENRGRINDLCAAAGIKGYIFRVLRCDYNHDGTTSVKPNRPVPPLFKNG